jgi:hypothetical protein
VATLTCTACGETLLAEQLACKCGAPRPRQRQRPRPDGSRPPADDAPPTPGPASDRAPAQPVGSGDENGCDHREARPGALTCPTCGSVVRTGGGFVLHLPWGPHRLEPGQELAFGRETGPFQSQIRAYPTVGRRHALLRCTPRGALLLIDEGSTNLSFHNGEPVPPHTPIEVHSGDHLCLSTRFAFTVESY